MNKIWYCIINNGDGSVYPAFYATKEQAEDREKYEEITYGEGWAEPSVGFVTAEFDDDGLFLNPELDYEER